MGRSRKDREAIYRTRVRRLAEQLYGCIVKGEKAVRIGQLWSEFGEDNLPGEADIHSLGGFAKFVDSCGLPRQGRPSEIRLASRAIRFVELHWRVHAVPGTGVGDAGVRARGRSNFQSGRGG
ncbi:hypothetical protein [Pseudodesulfovibrio tunisiensis]|uniref:hypothetical protein n=1 Tax=Pseudodesulfovibrio tunisiensis TaxID=463192 RepID=UPI001FB53D65|nr:hypothetical protein [Pseudodesulfovibrio tunisiensis]